MSTRFDKLNLERRGKYMKDPSAEDLVLEVNEALLPMEQARYRDVSVDQPYIFVFGLPRSGTTLITQLIAQCTKSGFINNFMARFWKVPVTGIRFARALGLADNSGSFESTFGATDSLLDIHEFGYFWRHWLRKKTFEDIEQAAELEREIDWPGLYAVLANIQNEFDRPVVMKNALGAYHLGKLKETIGMVIYVYIERDELDVAESILKARRQYYEDPNKWWSYVPPDFRKVFDLDYWHQIAGQVALLQQQYERELNNPDVAENVIRVRYEDLVMDPAGFLEHLTEMCEALYGRRLDKGLEPPALELRSGNPQSEERERFRELLDEFRRNGGFDQQ